MLRNSLAKPVMIAALGATILLSTALTTQSNAIDEHDATANPPSDHEKEAPFKTVDVAEENETETGLMAAVATNGRFGYVRSDELRDAERRNIASSPKEAVSKMEDREKIAVEILSAHLGGNSRDGLLTKSEETKYVRLWKEIEANGLEMALGKHASADPEAGDPIATPTQKAIQDIRDDLNDAFAEKIDVYDADGTTVIGTFLVGSY